MISIHEWTMQPYEAPKTLKDHPVLVHRYWFGEGEGDEEHKLDITVLGLTTVSVSKPLSYASVASMIEYGTIVYQGVELKVIGPIAAIKDQWTCYGMLKYATAEEVMAQKTLDGQLGYMQKRKSR